MADRMAWTQQDIISMYTARIKIACMCICRCVRVCVCVCTRFDIIKMATVSHMSVGRRHPVTINPTVQAPLLFIHPFNHTPSIRWCMIGQARYQFYRQTAFGA